MTTEYLDSEWVAFFEPETQPYGYGATEDEAIADLGTLYDDGFFEPAAERSAA